ncbi:hypothetical protein QBC41DRAFT_16244 [Cercophora samala]|uniref:F-box domain-containing protein n=1 Tax=Cercophora samala TaxID=330535 RepID=A0AA39Z6U9_9PEZI|nr:hypothetical protein QBC41DRAFT_16244 [Cercophora samala]
MTTTHFFGILPFETVSSVVDSLSQKDRVSLASTCHSVRQRLLPFLYHTLTFSNAPVISNSALLAAQSHGKYVKALRFVGYAYKTDDDMDTDLWKRPILRRDTSILYVPRYDGQPDEDAPDYDEDGDSEYDSDEERREQEEDAEWLFELWEDWSSRHSIWEDCSTRPSRDQLPPSAVALFHAARTKDQDGLFPNLETFSISFPHDYSQQADFIPLGADGMFGDLELSWGDVSRRESNFTMCRLWRNTFEEVSKNYGIAPRKLVLENWHPRGVTTFQSQMWSAYLSKLECFEVNLMASNLNGGHADTLITQVDGYVHSVGRMDEFFFRHLTEVKELTVSMGGLGMPEDSQAHLLFGLEKGEGRWERQQGHVPLPPLHNPDLMPCLEEVTLKHIFISQSIVDLIVSRRDKLKKLELVNAQAYVPPEYNGEPSDWERPAPMSWEAFFDAVCGALDTYHDMALSELTFTSPVNMGDQELEREARRHTRHTSVDSRNQMRKRVEILAGAHPERRLFGYGCQRGCFLDDPEANARSIEEGKDMAAFSRFVGKMHEKKERDRYKEFAVQVKEASADA